MKKITRRIIALVVAFAVISVPILADVQVFAAGNCVPTSILGGKKCEYDGNNLVEKDGGSITCSCDNGSGDSVTGILELVVKVMSIGIGILGVIGITVVGIQYLTAGGKEEQTRKAKRRLLEIVIGLAVYAVIYALLQWLLPGF